MIEEASDNADLDVANALYNQMLRLLTQAWGRQNADVAAKRFDAPV